MDFKKATMNVGRGGIAEVDKEADVLCNLCTERERHRQGSKPWPNVPILNGPNWGTWSILFQVVARILDCWDITKGEITSAVGVSPPTYDRLEYPTTTVFPNPKDFVAAKTTWNKKMAKHWG